MERINLRGKVGVKKREICLKDSLPSPLGEGGLRACGVCFKNKSSYNCPGCFVPYCSVKCFQDHSQDCCEEFHKSRVKSVIDFEQKSSLLEESFSSEEVKESYEEHETDNENGEMTEELRELINDISSNGIDERALSEEDRRFILRSARRQTAQKPAWWDGQSNSTVNRQATVAQIDEISDNSHSLRDICANLKDRLELLPHPMKFENPSPIIRLHFIALLFGYVITVRTYNSDWFSSREEAASLLSQSCPSFSPSFRPESIGGTLEACIRYRPPTLQDTSRVAIKRIWNDVLSLFTSKETLIYALWECWLMCCSSHFLATVFSDPNKELESGVNGNVADVEVYAVVLTRYYSPFSSPLHSVNKTDSDTRRVARTSELLQIDTTCRKCYFFLMTAILGMSASQVKDISREMKAYSDEFLS